MYAAARDGVKRTTVQDLTRGNDFNEDAVNPELNDPEGDGCTCSPLEGSRTGNCVKRAKRKKVSGPSPLQYQGHPVYPTQLERSRDRKYRLGNNVVNNFEV